MWRRERMRRRRRPTSHRCRRKPSRTREMVATSFGATRCRPPASRKLGGFSTTPIRRSRSRLLRCREWLSVKSVAPCALLKAMPSSALALSTSSALPARPTRRSFADASPKMSLSLIHISEPTRPY